MDRKTFEAIIDRCSEEIDTTYRSVKRGYRLDDTSCALYYDNWGRGSEGKRLVCSLDSEWPKTAIGVKRWGEVLAIVEQWNAGELADLPHQMPWEVE